MGQISRQRRYSREEVARRGDGIYEREVLPLLSSADEGKYALIDIETADYEIDRDEIAASDRLLARHPDAQVWMRQVGSRYARRFDHASCSVFPSTLPMSVHLVLADDFFEGFGPGTALPHLQHFRQTLARDLVVVDRAAMER